MKDKNTFRKIVCVCFFIAAILCVAAATGLFSVIKNEPEHKFYAISGIVLNSLACCLFIYYGCSCFIHLEERDTRNLRIASFVVVQNFLASILYIFYMIADKKMSPIATSVVFLGVISIVITSLYLSKIKKNNPEYLVVISAILSILQALLVFLNLDIRLIRIISLFFMAFSLIIGIYFYFDNKLAKEKVAS